MTAGQEINCGGLLEYAKNTCQTEVDFKLADKSFTLAPGQSHQLTDTPIKSISLLESSVTAEKVYDWGIGTYVTYVLNFSDSISPTPPPLKAEPLNFFQKIWHLIATWFK